MTKKKCAACWDPISAIEMETAVPVGDGKYVHHRCSEITCSRCHSPCVLDFTKEEDGAILCHKCSGRPALKRPRRVTGKNHGFIIQIEDSGVYKLWPSPTAAAKHLMAQKRTGPTSMIHTVGNNIALASKTRKRAYDCRWLILSGDTYIDAAMFDEVVLKMNLIDKLLSIDLMKLSVEKLTLISSLTTKDGDSLAALVKLRSDADQVIASIRKAERKA